MNAASVFGGFCLLEGKVDMWMFLHPWDKEQDKRKAQGRKGFFLCLAYPSFMD
jgi:hypothetical protein